MGDFTPIETQEQFDAAIGERIKRERETQEKKYNHYISPDDFAAKSKEYEARIDELNKKIADANERLTGYDRQIADRDAKIKGYETNSVKTRIAHETGLSYDAIKFLQGEDEENIRKSAQALKSLCRSNQTAPLADSEHVADAQTAAYKKLAAGITKNE